MPDSLLVFFAIFFRYGVMGLCLLEMDLFLICCCDLHIFNTFTTTDNITKIIAILPLRISRIFIETASDAGP